MSMRPELDTMNGSDIKIHSQKRCKDFFVCLFGHGISPKELVDSTVRGCTCRKRKNIPEED
jgi:hypothetical protein